MYDRRVMANVRKFFADSSGVVVVQSFVQFGGMGSTGFLSGECDG